MEGKISVTVEGRQRVENGLWESSQTLAEGICQMRLQQFLVSYEEITELGLVHNTLCLSPKEIFIKKRGAVSFVLDLVPGEAKEAAYEMSYGTIPLQVDTSFVDLQMRPDEITANAAYVLLSGGSPFSENEIRITIRPAS